MIKVNLFCLKFPKLLIYLHMIKLLILLSIICITTNAYTQGRITNDTIYLYDIPIGEVIHRNSNSASKIEIDDRYFDILSYDIVENYVIKHVMQNNIRINNIHYDDISYNDIFIKIDASKYENIKKKYDLTKLKPYIHLINVEQAATLYNTKNTIFIIGSLISALYTTSENPNAAFIIMPVVTITAIILDYSGNYKMKKKYIIK